METAPPSTDDPDDGVDVTLIRWMLSLTPAERLQVLQDHVDAVISLTSPMCPVAGQIVEDVKTAIEGVDGVSSAEVELTFDPPWTPERISPLVRASLGL